jgi:hypothetical protein
MYVIMTYITYMSDHVGAATRTTPRRGEVRLLHVIRYITRTGTALAAQWAA